MSDISKSNGLRHQESCQSGGGDRRRNSKQHANRLEGDVLEGGRSRICLFSCLPKGRMDWRVLGGISVCVWQTVGSELKRLLNKKPAFYKQVSKLVPTKAVIKVPVCFDPLQN